jgi:hypothetical protein
MQKLSVINTFIVAILSVVFRCNGLPVFRLHGFHFLSGFWLLGFNLEKKWVLVTSGQWMVSRINMEYFHTWVFNHWYKTFQVPPFLCSLATPWAQGCWTYSTHEKYCTGWAELLLLAFWFYCHILTTLYLYFTSCVQNLMIVVVQVRKKPISQHSPILSLQMTFWGLYMVTSPLSWVSTQLVIPSTSCYSILNEDKKTPTIYPSHQVLSEQ